MSCLLQQRRETMSWSNYSGLVPPPAGARGKKHPLHTFQCPAAGLNKTTIQTSTKLVASSEENLVATALRSKFNNAEFHP